MSGDGGDDNKSGAKTGTKKKPRATTSVPTTPEPQELGVVLDALRRLHARALIFEYIATHVADAFRGTDARGPSKLLLMPDGTRRRADTEDVLEIEIELKALAAAERRKMKSILSVGVAVDPAATYRPPLPPVPLAPPEGERVDDVRGADTSSPRSSGTVKSS